jgi:hypothetical protein
MMRRRNLELKDLVSLTRISRMTREKRGKRDLAKPYLTIFQARELLRDLNSEVVVYMNCY